MLSYLFFKDIILKILFKNNAKIFNLFVFIVPHNVLLYFPDNVLLYLVYKYFVLDLLSSQIEIKCLKKRTTHQYWLHSSEIFQKE